jgi:metal-sulfur cluster biosynthetic enzyme
VTRRELPVWSAPAAPRRPLATAGLTAEAEAVVRSIMDRLPHEDDSPRPWTGAAPDVAPLWQALREVRDPELPVSVVDLGLIYDIRRAGSRVDVDLTFTATACPCMEFIRMDITERLLLEDDVDDVVIHEVWNPPWTTERMTPEGRAILRSFGVAA